MGFSSISAPETIHHSVSVQSRSLQGSNCHFATRWVYLELITYLQSLWYQRNRRQILLMSLYTCTQLSTELTAETGHQNLQHPSQYMYIRFSMVHFRAIGFQSSAGPCAPPNPWPHIWGSTVRLLVPEPPTYTHIHQHPPMCHPTALHPQPQRSAISWAEPFCTSLISSGRRGAEGCSDLHSHTGFLYSVFVGGVCLCCCVCVCA